METNAFKNGMEELEDIAIKQKTAYMCSEALWWRCHRAMISDYLKSIGWMVHHIMEINKSNEHRYTQPAKIINGKLSYHSTELF